MLLEMSVILPSMVIMYALMMFLIFLIQPSIANNKLQVAKQTRVAKAQNKKQQMRELCMKVRLAIIGVLLTGIYAVLCASYIFSCVGLLLL